MLIKVFGTYINPVNIAYLQDHRIAVRTDIIFLDGKSKVDVPGTSRDVAAEINKQIKEEGK